MKIGKFKKIAAIGLALTMAIGLLYTGSTVNAVEENPTEDSGIKLNKTATWNDETEEATIKLEAYATGKVETGKPKPLDIVLVLDQSGSMKNSDYVESLQTSVRSFVNTIQKNAAANQVDHRVAIVGYASDEDDGKSDGYSMRVSPGSSDKYWINTGIYINGVLKNYKNKIQTYNKVYSLETSWRHPEYFIIVNGNYIQIQYHEANYWDNDDYWYYTTGSVFDDTFEIHKIECKTSEADTNLNHVQVYTRDESWASLTSQDYQNALVSVNQSGSLNSDISTAIENYGYSGATRTSYGMEMAKNVFANNSAEGRQRIVVVFTDGEPGQSEYNTSEAAKAVNESYEIKQTYGASVYTIGLYGNANYYVTNFMNYLSSNCPNASYNDRYDRWQSTDKVSDKYYMTTANQSNLEDIFKQIAEDVSSSNTELDDSAVITDYISDSFNVPNDGNIKAYTVNYKGDNNWDNDRTYINKEDIKRTNNKITVTGFNYKENYVVEHDPQNQNKPTGKKLVIEITVTPKDGFIGGNNVFTNDEAFISYQGEKVANFPKPHVDISLKYNGISTDQTIYLGSEWNDIIKMIENPTKEGFQYTNNRNNRKNDTEYTIDGVKNKYVIISYEVKQGNKIIGTYTINAGEKIGSWKPDNYNINSSQLSDCTVYSVSIKVTPKDASCSDHSHVEATEINDSITPTLHILKPMINVNDTTISFGTRTNLNDDNIDENISWTSCNHNKTVSDVVSGINPPQYSIDVNAVANGDKLEKNNSDYIFIPQKPIDGQFELVVKNNRGNDITDYVIIKNGSQYINKFTVHVVSGKLKINKNIIGNEIESSDGDPIFTFKITVSNDILGWNRVYYRYYRVGSKLQYNVLEGLPVGEYTIEELDTLRYSYSDSTVESNDSKMNLDNIESVSKGKKYKISKFNLTNSLQENINNVTINFTNKLASTDNDSDNDIVVNTFKYVDGEIQIGQELKD